ncbi:flagellar hook-basal body complex protein FliE [Xylophilus sp. GW821-FHT01B05]
MENENSMAASINASVMRMEASASSITAMYAAPVLPAMDGQWPRGVEGGFLASMQAAVRGVDAKERMASDRIADVDGGRSDDLVGAMLASQEASLSFSMLMQVRNKVVGAMDELIKLQV